MELGLLAGSGWAAGLNVYAVYLVLGLVGRFGGADVPEPLTATPLLVLAGVLYLVEFVADKIPYLDNVWDAAHTVIRPVAAAFLGVLLADDAGISELLGAGMGGGLALASHSVKATTRATVNVSPEPVSNTALSLFEDGLVAGIMALALAFPAVALVVVILLLIGGTWVVVKLWRAIARVWAKIGERAETVA